MKIKQITKTIVITLITILLAYIVMFFWVDSFSEGMTSTTYELNTEVDLGLEYNTDVYEALLNATDDEIKNAYIYSIHEKADQSATVYTFYKDYTFISDFFATGYTPVKEVQIYYDRSSMTVTEMTVSKGNSLLLNSKYIDDEWMEILLID